MNSENFAYWLQGYFELLGKDEPLTKEQVQIIKDHLALVFDKVTPDRKIEPVTVAPPIQPTQVPGKTDLEEIFKKLDERRRTENPDLRTYCSPRTGVEFWAGRPSISGRGGRSMC